MTLPLQRPRRSGYGRVFLLCLALAAALFLPHCIADGVSGSFFHYAGDFNDQMIPFYAYANDFVKRGGSFSWATDLGSGFVNAYSYYCLGSPFFWLTLWVPPRWMPFTMVPVLCLKFAVAGGGAYLWLRRWVKDENWSAAGAVLYAFCGYNIYNIFFFFFLDSAALFPYMLAALDDAVLDGRRGCFPFWVALNLLTNYFFFAGQAVFLLLYFLCLCAGRVYRLTPRTFGRLAFETLLGCAAGCVLLIPAGLSLLQNPRTIDPFDGYGYLVYGKAQQYLAILFSAFLMPDAPYLTDLFSEGVTKWTSLSAYLPVVGLAGGIAFCRVWRRHPFARLLKICALCAFVPALNSLFYALNSSYYARWYYMPLLVLCAATCRALQRESLRRTEVRRALRLVLGVTLAAAAFALVPSTDDEGAFCLGVVDNQLRFWALFAVSVLGCALFWWLLRLGRRTPRRFAGMLLAAVSGFVLLYGSVHISITKYGQWYNDRSYVPMTWGSVDELRAVLPQEEFYRLDAYECYNNMGVWLDRPCINCFHSTVAPHILAFYPSVGVTRDVNSKPGTELYALRGLLSVRYTLVPKDAAGTWAEDAARGWTLAAATAHYDVYENENWVPMGLCYDWYITPERIENVPEEERAAVLMKALLLTEEQAARTGLLPLPDAELEARSWDDYTADCAARRATAAVDFTATRTGFTARTERAEPGLALFSVPYDDGFSAAVNGETAEIWPVDNGLMAVEVPAGAADIVFTYRTPGLRLSAGITLGAWAVYAVYLIGLAVGRHPRKATERPAKYKKEETE